MITIDRNTEVVLEDIDAKIQITQQDSLHTFDMRKNESEYSSGRILSYGTIYKLLVSGEGYFSETISSKLTNGIPVLNLFRGFNQDTIKLKPIPKDSVEVVLSVENPSTDVKIFVKSPFERSIDGRVAKILIPKDDIVKVKISANNYEEISDEFLASENLNKSYNLQPKIYKREIQFFVKNMGGNIYDNAQIQIEGIGKIEDQTARLIIGKKYKVKASVSTLDGLLVKEREIKILPGNEKQEVILIVEYQ